MRDWQIGQQLWQHTQWKLLSRSPFSNHSELIHQQVAETFEGLILWKSNPHPIF
jgi:hypothetical protein